MARETKGNGVKNEDIIRSLSIVDSCMETIENELTVLRKALSGRGSSKSANRSKDVEKVLNKRQDRRMKKSRQTG